MERAETLKILKDLLESEFLAGKSIELDASTPLLREGVLDSFSLLHLAVRLEETFGVSIALESLRLEQFEDLNAISKLVESMRPST